MKDILTTLKMEKASSSEALLPIHQSIWPNINTTVKSSNLTNFTHASKL